MKKIKNETIRKKFCSGFTRTKDVTTIVIHGTGGGHTLPWIEEATGTRAEMYKKGIGLFHYLIDQGSPYPDGQIIEVIDPLKWVFHASVGRLDHGTIGIELLNKGFANSGGFSQKQIDSLVELCVALKKQFPTVFEFVGHGRMKQRIDRARKAWKICPGPNFPWALFASQLSDRMNRPVYRDPAVESCWIDRDR